MTGTKYPSVNEHLQHGRRQVRANADGKYVDENMERDNPTVRAEI